MKILKINTCNDCSYHKSKPSYLDDSYILICSHPDMPNEAQSERVCKIKNKKVVSFFSECPLDDYHYYSEYTESEDI